jgi:DNA-directed RNA polymerase beta subunit
MNMAAKTEKDTKIVKSTKQENKDITPDTKTIKYHLKLAGNMRLSSSASLAPLIHAMIQRDGPVQHHIDSFNELLKSRYGLKQIITGIFSINSDVIPDAKLAKATATGLSEQIERVHIQVNFVGVSYSKPYVSNASGTIEPMLPQFARDNSRTYSVPVYVNVYISATGYKAMLPGAKVPPPPIERKVTLTNHHLATLPIMVRSELCSTYGMSDAELIAAKEDPKDKGGYFVVQGRDFAISSVETITYNAIHVHKKIVPSELVSGMMISKPGDGFENSAQLTVRLHTDKSITVEFGSEPLAGLLIPFYILFRMFGISSDFDIINIITFYAGAPAEYANVETNAEYPIADSMELRRKMNDILAYAIHDAPVPGGTATNSLKSFKEIRDVRIPEEIIRFIGAKISRLKSRPNADNNIRFNNTDFLKKIDDILFPHMGGSSERIMKLKLLGHIIDVILKVHLGAMNVSDRDSYLNKRVFSPAFVLSREIKRAFNNVIIKPVRQRMINAFKNNAFSNVDLSNVFTTAVRQLDLERAIVRSIISGKKDVVIGQKVVSNRIMSQDITWRNQLFTLSILRTVSPSGKPVSNTSQRAIDLRAVHTTTVNSICPAQTPETGDKIGKARQMTILTRLTLSTSSEVLIRILLEDPVIVPIENITEEEILNRNMTRVFTNGRYIGVTAVIAHDLARKYRILRRHGEIDKYTSIYVNVMTLDIYFSTEQGRLVFPLLVVKDYKREMEFDELVENLTNGDFHPTGRKVTRAQGQDIMITDKDLEDFAFGRITVDDLEKRGAIEYITPDEQDNCLIAEDYRTLRENAHNPTVRYTHCQIPQNIFGYTALTSPFNNYTDTVRVSYMTNHTRQACGWPTLNFGYRCDRKFYVQTYVENPLVQTIVTPHTYPHGTNLMVAYCPFEGLNQEDSAIVNASSIDRGLMSITSYTYVDAVIEKGETITNPNAANTQLILNANYSKIINGLPKVGTIINKDDVVIGRIMESGKEGTIIKYIDHSIVYKMIEPSIVDSVYTEINSEGKHVKKVKLRSYRRFIQGDKVSSRYGNKSIASNILPACELPVSVDGDIPDIIIDSQGISKRMLLGQINECLVSTLAAKLGAVIDGTAFSHIDHTLIQETLEECGVDNWGFKRMINGRTGEEYQALICLCPNYYLRLQKFIVDGMYAVATGPTDALTRQPLRGKAIKGGLRLSEMEKDALIAHGGMFAFREKFCNNSDGFDLFICRKCGKVAIYNPQKGIYRCQLCSTGADIVKVASCYMSLIFNHQLHAAHINTRYHIKKIPFFEEE